MRTLVLFLGLIAATWTANAPAGDMSEAVAAIARHRNTSLDDIRIVLHEHEFAVLEGTSGPLPEAELERLKNPVLSVGNVGTEVAAIQAALIAQGLLTGAPDEKFGVKTKRAVIAFQRQKGLPADGMVGNATWEALELPTPRAAEWYRTESVSVRENSFVRSYRVSPELEIRETVNPTGDTVSWTKRIFRELARDDKARWPAFLNSLIPHGLQSYETVHTDQLDYAVLTLHAEKQPRQPLGTSSIILSDESYRFLKLSSEHPPRPSTSGRNVVLIHEPHSDGPGQFQLIEGLDALVRANDRKQFKFLVEGDLREQGRDIYGNPLFAMEGNRSERGRDIPLESLSALLSTEASVRRAQVHFLVRNYLIDGPLAYRLLYGDVPALAIDDQLALDRTPPMPPGLSQFALHELLVGLFSGLNSLNVESSRSAAEAVLRLQRTRSVDIDGAGKDLVAWYGELENACTGLARALGKIEGRDYAAQIQMLKRYADDYKNLRVVFEQALVRDRTMAYFIGRHFQTADAERIPLAFIGSFHTKGIIALLPMEVGYVVLEPRFQSSPTKLELEKFNTALHDYPRSLEQAEQRARKLGVLPPISALPSIARIADRIAGKTLKVRVADDAGLASGTIASVTAAIERNGALDVAEIHVGGGGRGAPPGYENAFAAFEMGPDGSERTFKVFDEKDASGDVLPGRWDDRARLDYLQHVLVLAPLELGGARERSARKVTFFQDPVSKTNFFNVLDRGSNTAYFFQAEAGLDGASILALLPSSSASEIHLRLSKLLQMFNNRNNNVEKKHG
jgi:hypothetical protein